MKYNFNLASSFKSAITFFVLLPVISMANSKGELLVKKQTHLGPLKNQVIFQSTNLKKTKSKSVYTGKLVAKWGEHVYEVVKGSYECKKSTCELIDYSRIATFELCKVKSQKVTCSNKISGDPYEMTDESSEIVFENVDEVSDSMSGVSHDDSSVDNSGTRSVYDEFGDLYN